MGGIKVGVRVAEGAVDGPCGVEQAGRSDPIGASFHLEVEAALLVDRTGRYELLGQLGAASE